MHLNLNRVVHNSFPDVTPVFIAGVHVLPAMISELQIKDLLEQKERKIFHHDGGNHVGHDKNLTLPWLAELIWLHVRDIELDGLQPHSVDPMMKIYELCDTTGAVSPHQDEDFNGPEGSMARYSIIMYLNNGYLGGETIFHSTVRAPHAEVGGGLLFRHDLHHEGLPVQSGVKYVLKTDLFVK